jgi:hypothetical protein
MSAGGQGGAEGIVRYASDPPTAIGNVTLENEQEEIRTGIVDAILTGDNLVMAVQLLVDAWRRKSAGPWFLVRSQNRYYATNVRPEDTHDMDAIYIYEIPKRGAQSERLKALFAHLEATPATVFQ